ncbi:MAG: hypothetical protein GX112_05605 [Clostridiaceae bacterium]|jgi:hypothetical protein|nr:hypothetical protein [Clostridiaceae bacterium]
MMNYMDFTPLQADKPQEKKRKPISCATGRIMSLIFVQNVEGLPENKLLDRFSGKLSRLIHLSEKRSAHCFTGP